MILQWWPSYNLQPLHCGIIFLHFLKMVSGGSGIIPFTWLVTAIYWAGYCIQARLSILRGTELGSVSKAAFQFLQLILASQTFELLIINMLDINYLINRNVAQYALHIISPIVDPISGSQSTHRSRTGETHYCLRAIVQYLLNFFLLVESVVTKRQWWSYVIGLPVPSSVRSGVSGQECHVFSFNACNRSRECEATVSLDIHVLFVAFKSSC